MSCEVHIYCDTCGTNMLVDQVGMGTFREAVSIAIDNAVQCGYRRTKKGWQCPGCLVGRPNVFDIDKADDVEARDEAVRLYREKYGVDLWFLSAPAIVDRSRAALSAPSTANEMTSIPTPDAETGDERP